MNQELLEVFLSELYGEQRQKREMNLNIVTRYIWLCMIVIGWFLTVKGPISPCNRCLIAFVIVAIGIVVAFLLTSNVRVYSETARTIVKIADKHGMFDSYFCSEWKHWGQYRALWLAWWIWPQAVVILIGAATTSYILLRNVF